MEKVVFMSPKLYLMDIFYMIIKYFMVIGLNIMPILTTSNQEFDFDQAHQIFDGDSFSHSTASLCLNVIRDKDLYKDTIIFDIVMSENSYINLEIVKLCTCPNGFMEISDANTNETLNYIHNYSNEKEYSCSLTKQTMFSTNHLNIAVTQLLINQTSIDFNCSLELNYNEVPRVVHDLEMHENYTPEPIIYFPNTRTRITLLSNESHERDYLIYEKHLTIRITLLDIDASVDDYLLIGSGVMIQNIQGTNKGSILALSAIREDTTIEVRSSSAWLLLVTHNSPSRGDPALKFTWEPAATRIVKPSDLIGEDVRDQSISICIENRLCDEIIEFKHELKNSLVILINNYTRHSRANFIEINGANLVLFGMHNQLKDEKAHSNVTFCRLKLGTKNPSNDNWALFKGPELRKILFSESKSINITIEDERYGTSLCEENPLDHFAITVPGLIVIMSGIIAMCCVLFCTRALSSGTRKRMNKRYGDQYHGCRNDGTSSLATEPPGSTDRKRRMAPLKPSTSRKGSTSRENTKTGKNREISEHHEMHRISGERNPSSTCSSISLRSGPESTSSCFESVRIDARKEQIPREIEISAKSLDWESPFSTFRGYGRNDEEYARDYGSGKPSRRDRSFNGNSLTVGPWKKFDERGSHNLAFENEETSSF